VQISLTFSRPAKPVSVQEIAISSSTPCIAASAKQHAILYKAIYIYIALYIYYSLRLELEQS
jgi:hypothetical protein